MKTNEKISFDKELLENELSKRNLTKSGVSRDMGFNEAYLSNAVARGYMGKPAANMLKAMFNINLSDIQKPEVIEEEKIDDEPSPTTMAIDPEQLKQIIFEAVYEAVKKAWAE